MRPCWISLYASILAATTVAAQQRPALVPDSSRQSPSDRAEHTQAFTIHSRILDQARRVDVVLPASYAESSASRRYPVTVILDGEATVTATAAVSGELARNGMIPEAIIVAIENVGGDEARVHDLTPPGLSVSGSGLEEGGNRFLDFIEREVLPAVDAQFRGAQPRTLIGHSSGAILATYAAATRSTYRAVISVDAPVSLGDDWLARKLTARAAAPLTPLRYVSYEARFGWSDAAWQALVAAAPKAWMLRREPLRLEGHETLYMLAAYLGLREVFRDYSRLAVQGKTAAEILPYYETLGTSWGAQLVPPRRVLRDAVDDLIAEGRGRGADSAYTWLVKGYGRPSDGAELESEIAEAKRRPEPAETVASLLATPFPTPAQASRFIGDWVGSHWMTRDEPRANRDTLRVREVDGRVTAELINPAAPPQLRVRKVDYLRVTSAGLTYGFLNGMRPRGVVLWEGTLQGDTLSGTQRWGGVASPLPADARLDPGFLYTRVRK